MIPAHRARVWKSESSLFPLLSESASMILDKFPQFLEKVWPLSRAHRRQLPADIQNLSALLTTQRGGLRRNYWSKPEFISAYLYYFLPWNLVRFCKVLAALPLNSPKYDVKARSLLIDAGAGPLTATIGLWIARAEWRDIPITALAFDSVRQPLDLGRKLLAALSEALGVACWDIKTGTGPLEALGKFTLDLIRSYPELTTWLSITANVLNEIKPPKVDNSTGVPDQERYLRLLEAWLPFWQNGAQMLFMEPGTRLGGTIIMRLREAAIELGVLPLSPCTHKRVCPLDDQASNRLPSSWCHFVFTAQDGPEWLRNLSRKAGLFKTSLTLSPLLLSTHSGCQNIPEQAAPVRIVSQAFRVDGALSRYGCSTSGRVLLPDSANLISGSLCYASKPYEGCPRDARSGAVIVNPYKN